MAYIYDLSDTWNAGGTTFYGIKMNVTDTASAAGSKLVSLQLSGVDKFSVDKNGNVGVGTGTALGRLHVETPSGTATRVRWFQNGVTNYGWTIPASTDAFILEYDGTERMRVTASGNFGFGTSTPGYRVDIEGTSRHSGLARFENGAIFSDPTLNVVYFNGEIGFSEDGVGERVRIKGNGQFRLVPLSADPSGGENGDMYYNSTTHKFRGYANGSWVDLH